MLNNLSEQIRDCYRHAQDCARKAAKHADPKLKQDFLELEESWLFLARSFEFNERLSDFSDEIAGCERDLDRQSASKFDPDLASRERARSHGAVARRFGLQPVPKTPS
jgi:uncharacterized protein